MNIGTILKNTLISNGCLFKAFPGAAEFCNLNERGQPPLRSNEPTRHKSTFGPLLSTIGNAAGRGFIKFNPRLQGYYLKFTFLYKGLLFKVIRKGEVTKYDARSGKS